MINFSETGPRNQPLVKRAPEINPRNQQDNPEWIIAETIYTIDELAKEIKNEGVKNVTKEASNIIIMLGTNDIRKRSSEPEEAAKKLKECTTLLQKEGKTVTIVTPPQCAYQRTRK